MSVSKASDQRESSWFKLRYAIKQAYTHRWRITTQDMYRKTAKFNAYINFTDFGKLDSIHKNVRILKLTLSVTPFSV